MQLMSKCLLLGFLLLQFLCFSQMNCTVVSDAYSFKSYDVSNGLPQSSVNVMRQSRDGFIWMATFAGIARFDGESFKSFDAGNIRGLQSDMFYLMVNDNGNGIWSMSGANLMHLAKNSTRHYALPFDAFKCTRSGLAVKGTDVFVQGNEVLYQLKPEGLTRYCNVPEELYLLEGDGKNLYFRGKENRALYILENKVFKQVFEFPESYTELFFKEGRICFSKHLQLYDVQAGGVYTKHIFPDHLPENYQKIIPLLNKRYALLLDNKMMIYDEPKHTTETIEVVGGNVNNIQFKAEDLDGELWVLTNQFSLVRLFKKDIRSYPNFTLHGKEYFIGEYFIFFNKADSSYWVDSREKNRSWEKHLFQYKRENMSSELTGYSFEITSMLIDHNDNMWLCGTGEPVLIKYKHAKKLKKIPVRSRTFYSVFESSDKKIWLGTDEGAFVQQADTSFTQHLACKNVYQIEEDKTGALWFATAQGLYRSFKGTIKHYGIEEGLPTNEIRCVYPDDDGTVWIGTCYFGLCRLKNERIFHYPVDEDLINRNVWSIIEDRYGSLWMSSNNGIYRLNEKELNDFADDQGPLFYSEHYSVLNGIYNPEFNSRTQNKGFMDHEGHVWFPSVRGPVNIDPKRFTRKKRFPIQIENILVNGEKTLDEDSIIIHSGKNTLQIEYTVPFFENTNKPVFCYRLFGFDDSWHKTKNRRIEFRDIPAGDYVLLLCLNNNPATAKFFRVHVEERFYETITFIILISIVLTSIPFILALWSIKVLNRRRLQRKHEQLFLSSMKVMSITSQLNPHFIFNCLNTLQSMYLTRNFELANEFMGNFSKLLRLTIEHLRKQHVTLREELALVNLYVALESIQFENPFDYQLIIDDDINTNEIQLPAMLMQIFTENAIKHGLHGLKDRKGELTIRVSKTANAIKISIHDNGIGIDAGKQPEPTKNTPSRGTALVLEQVALYNQVSQNKIYIHIRNLQKENSGEFGTIISVIYTAFK